MGVLGWNLLAPWGTLRGRVVAHSYTAADGDWALTIAPSPGFEWILTKPSGQTNVSGEIECEVEPTDSVGAEAKEVEFFGPLTGKLVTVEGAWSEDISHPEIGNPTEIHPIYSILCDEGEVHLGAVTRLTFMVLSDDSTNFGPLGGAPVPFSGLSQSGTFRVPYPPGGDCVPTFRIAHELNMSEDRHFSIDSVGSQHFLTGSVISGVAPNQGFYRVVIDRFLDTTLAYVPAPAGPAVPAECGQIKQQMSSLETQLEGLGLKFRSS